MTVFPLVMNFNSLGFFPLSEGLTGKAGATRELVVDLPIPNYYFEIKNLLCSLISYFDILKNVFQCQKLIPI